MPALAGAESPKAAAIQAGLVAVADPETYSALAYSPPGPSPSLQELLVHVRPRSSSTECSTLNSRTLLTGYAAGGEKPPLIVLLHGAGKNELDVWNLADPQGEHAGLAPSLLAAGTAPPALRERFAVLAPYSRGKASFYEEPRAKLLSFVEWALSDAGRAAGCPDADPTRVAPLARPPPPRAQPAGRPRPLVVSGARAHPPLPPVLTGHVSSLLPY